MVTANLLYSARNSPVTLLTTELNALANNALSALSAEYDNATLLRQNLVDFTLSLASLNIAALPAYALIYAVPIDTASATYPDVVTGTTPQIPFHYLLGKLDHITKNGTQLQSKAGLWLPAPKCKFAILSRLGVAMGATGNTLTMSAYNRQIV